MEFPREPRDPGYRPPPHVMRAGILDINRTLGTLPVEQRWDFWKRQIWDPYERFRANLESQERHLEYLAIKLQYTWGTPYYIDHYLNYLDFYIEHLGDVMWYMCVYSPNFLENYV